MSRANGRKGTQRTPVAYTPEQRETGESPWQDPAGSPINSQTGNITHPVVTRQEVQSPPPMDEFRGMMAHGVPHQAHATSERAQAERGGPNDSGRHAPPVMRHEDPPPAAVPVYLVERGGGEASFRTAYPRSISVPVTGTEPARLCGRDARRNRIGLLNESSAHSARFAQNISTLSVGNGALLQQGQTSYLWIESQDELYIVSADATAFTVSIIEEFSQKD